MSGWLAGRVALVFGAGSSGPGWGNGKAVAVAYAREGVVCVDVAKYVTGACLVVDGGLSATPLVSFG
jgi:hypothetical protein